MGASPSSGVHKSQSFSLSLSLYIYIYLYIWTCIHHILLPRAACATLAHRANMLVSLQASVEKHRLCWSFTSEAYLLAVFEHSRLLAAASWTDVGHSFESCYFKLQTDAPSYSWRDEWQSCQRHYSDSQWHMSVHRSICLHGSHLNSGWASFCRYEWGVCMQVKELIVAFLGYSGARRCMPRDKIYAPSPILAGALNAACDMHMLWWSLFRLNASTANMLVSLQASVEKHG